MQFRRLCAPVLFSFLTIAAAAQEVTATVNGVVTDTTGAVISGARITVFDIDKNLPVRTLTTSDEGQYVIPLLAVGRYRVTASAKGFRSSQRDRVDININDRLTLEFHLMPGAQNEEVSVAAPELQVEVASASASRLISGTEVRELAIMTRNYVELVPLQPGVSTALDSDQPYVGTTNPAGGTNFLAYSINGARPEQNSWTVDGANNLNRGLNLTLLDYPSIDSIQEFSVLRSTYEAEFGGGSGAQINVVTRSGTSSFHGSGFEFIRNEVLAANNYFNNRNGIERPPLRYNNFGFTIGGPIYIPGIYNKTKNKTFFFYSQEWRKAINYSTFYVSGVPTLGERQGHFATPICIQDDAATGNCAGPPTTQITAFDPTAKAYVDDIYSKMPAPNSDNTLFYAGRETFNFRQEIFRIDQDFNAKYSLFARFMDDSIPTQEANGLYGGIGLPGVQTTSTNSPGRGFTARLTMVLTPTLLNEAGYAYSYGGTSSAPIGTGSSIVSSDIRPELPFGIAGRVPSVSFQSGNGLSGFGPYQTINRQHAVFNTLTKVAGKHTLKFGATWNHYEEEASAGGFNNGLYFFFGNGADGNPSFTQQWANFLVGNVTYFEQLSLDLISDISQHQTELFAQDVFRVRPNLTLTYGLRWSLFRQPTDSNGYASTFDPASFNPAVVPAIDIKSGNLVDGTPTPVMNGMIIGGKNSPYGDAVAQQNNRCFAPRLGIAWDPFGDGKTAVRAGYGMFYESVRFDPREQPFNPPFTTTVRRIGTNLSHPLAGAALPYLLPQNISGPDPHWRAPYNQQWSLDLQRQLSTGTIFDIGYYGGKGTHLLGMIDINQPQAGAYLKAGIPGPINPATANLLNYVRPYQGFGQIFLFSTLFDSNYNSLQAQLRHRFTHNSIVVANYTWSHALTDGSATNQYPLSAPPQDTYDLKAEYGPTTFDRRHIFTASYVYYVPFFESQQSVAGHLLGGWEVSGALYLQSGLPLTATGPFTDPAGLGTMGYPNARLDQLGNANQNAPHKITQWFDPSLFTSSPDNEIRPGNGSVGSITGPGGFRWDASLLKNTNVGDHVIAQFRVEASNVLNHSNYDGVVTNLVDPHFGQVYSARDPRIIQLGLKLSF